MTNWTCKDDVLRAVSLDGHALENASEALRGDKDVVLAAVKQKGWALEYASPALRNDPEVVLAAVAVSIEAFDFASDALKNCKQTLLKAIEHWPSAFVFGSEALRGDKEVVLAAFRDDTSSIWNASPELLRQIGDTEDPEAKLLDLMSRDKHPHGSTAQAHQVPTERESAST